MLKRIFSIQSIQSLTFLKGFSCSCIGRQNQKINNFLSKTFTTSEVQRNVLHPFLENNFAFGIITKFTPTKDAFKETKIITLEEFEKFLGQNWRQSAANEIAKAFVKVQDFCVQNNIAVDDKRFNNLIDGIVDNCEHLTSEDIQVIMETLVAMPQARGYDAHNFHDLWSCLDDICCWKMVEWDPDSQFAIANLWFKLSLGM